MPSARQPHRLNNWRIEAHCRRCDWQTVWYVNREVARFRSHDAAIAYIKTHPNGPDQESTR